MSFETLGLSEELLRAVRTKGYETPSPIQKKAIPVVIQGKDVLAAAQTGTGKTAGFTLPMLHLLSQAAPPKGRRPIRALVVTPTRELAAQIQENVIAYGKNLKLYSTVIFGGVPANPQIRQLQRGVDVLVATPGRLLDLQNQGHVDLSTVEFLVLDEADRMLDMGFIHDIRKLLKLLPEKRQNLLFSATFSPEIRKLAQGFMNNPVSVEVAARNTAAETVKQTIYPVHKSRKTALLKHLIKQGDWKQVLVFTRTKHGANRLAKRLDRARIPALAIHGNKTQGARTKALAQFKENKIQVLVATDIAARGIDIEELPWVVNFDLPNVPEDYVHRIGRTGRAGQNGQAVSFYFDEMESKQLRDIERLLKKRLPTETLEDFDYSLKERPEGQHQNGQPRNVRGNRNQQGRNAQQKEPRRSTATNATADRPAKQQQSKRDQPQNAEQKESRNKRNNRNKKRQRDKSEQTVAKKGQNQEAKSANNKSANAPAGKSKRSKKKKDLIREGNKQNKGVSFAKASKKKKFGKKGPIGYGMYPLE